MIEPVLRRRVFMTKGENTMKVIVLAPNEKPTVKEIDNKLESLQGVVGGYIQAIYPFKDKVALVCNEEGKLDGLPMSIALVNKGIVSEMIAGTCFICGLKEDDFDSLSNKLCEKYLRKFNNPVGYVMYGDMIPAYEI